MLPQWRSGNLKMGEFEDLKMIFRRGGVLIF
jgi:hypothetical protein